MNRRILTLLIAASVACPLVGHAADLSAAARGKCQLGDSLAVCRKALPLRELTPDQTEELLRQWPFDRTYPFLVPLLKERRVVAWAGDAKDERGWPLHVFGVFSKDGKLEDLLASRGGSRDPLVDGVYSRAVEGLRKGMGVEEMYRLVGQNDPEYLKTPEGKWIVRFVYTASGGRFFVVTADAATGVILAASDQTI